MIHSNKKARNITHYKEALFEKWLVENAEMIKEMSVACRNKH